jgi:tRNA(fMet)-specific endonuclease VapC
MLWILDTDHMTHWQRSHPAVFDRLGNTDPTSYGTTVISLEEQMRSRLGQIHQVTSTDRLRFAYAALQNTDSFYQRTQVFDFSYGAEL